MGIESIVDVQISRATAQIEQAGFGRAMTLSEHTKFVERVRLYTSLTAVAEDFIATDPEYIAAQKYFSQDLKPVDIMIGRAEAFVAQVVTVVVDTLEDADYTVTINGVDFTYVPGGVPASKTVVVAALMAAINGGTEPVTASLTGTPPNEDLVLTADNAGESFTYAVTANMTPTLTTPNSGIAENLDAIIASGDLGKQWYALISMYREKRNIKAGAAWIEANKRIYIACSDDADVKTSATDDVASELQDAAYARTAFLWSGDQANYPEAAWLGGMLPTNPGSATWAFKTLAGITIDELTDTEIGYLRAKNANYYNEVGGVNITREGNVAEGEWIDVIRGIDWIEARMEENIYGLIVTVPKIPFTNPGIAQVSNQMEQILQQAVTRNILVSYVISLPKAEDFTQIQKQTRILTGITFVGTLAGAIHAITITGTVSV